MEKATRDWKTSGWEVDHDVMNHLNEYFGANEHFDEARGKEYLAEENE